MLVRMLRQERRWRRMMMTKTECELVCVRLVCVRLVCVRLVCVS